MIRLVGFCLITLLFDAVLDLRLCFVISFVLFIWFIACGLFALLGLVDDVTLIVLVYCGVCFLCY